MTRIDAALTAAVAVRFFVSTAKPLYDLSAEFSVGGPTAPLGGQCIALAERFESVAQQLRIMAAACGHTTETT